jgi:hypothetical protein
VEDLEEAYFKDSNFIAIPKRRFNQSGRRRSARASCSSCGRDLFMVAVAKFPVEERLRDKWRGYLIDTWLHVTRSPYKCSDCDLIVLCNYESFQIGLAGTVPQVYRMAIPSWWSARLCSTLMLRRCERLESFINMEDVWNKLSGSTSSVYVPILPEVSMSNDWTPPQTPIHLTFLRYMGVMILKSIGYRAQGCVIYAY